MKGKLARGVVWIAVSRIAINAIGLLSTLVLARLLLPADFGLVAIATAIFAIVSSFTELSLGSALVQHRDPTDDHYHTAFTLGLLRALLIGAVTAALAWPIAIVYGDDRLISLILALAGASVIGGLVNPRLAQLLRALEFRQEFTLGVANKLVGFLVAAAVAIIWRSYWALVLGAIAAQIASVIISYMLISYRPALSLAKTRELLSFSVWLTLSQVVMTLTYRFDALIIGYFIGQSQLGAYNLGDRLAVAFTRELTAPIANTLFPAFSRIEDDLQRLQAAYIKAQSVLFMVAVPLGFGAALVAEPFVHLFLGQKWSDAIIVIQFLAPILAIQSIMSPAEPLLTAIGKTRSVFMRELLFIGIRLPMLLFGIWVAGILGALCARAVGGLLGVFLNLYLLKQEIHLSLWSQFKRNVRPLIAAAAMVSAVIACRSISQGKMTMIDQYLVLAVQVCIGSLTYVSVLWLSWVISGRPFGGESQVLNLIEELKKKYSKY